MKSEKVWKMVAISVALLMVVSVVSAVNQTGNSADISENEALDSNVTSSADVSFIPVYKHPKMSPEIIGSIPPPEGGPLTPMTVIIYLTEDNPEHVEKLKSHVIKILDVEGDVVKAKIYTDKILDINALDFVSYIDVPLRPHQPEISQQSSFIPVYKHPKMSPEIIESIPPPEGGPLTPMTVIIYLTEENPEYIEELKPHVIDILDVEGDVVKAKIYTDKILDINALDFVSYIDVPLRPHQPEFISIGVECMHADKWHELNETGKGVKVAVLEVGGFAGYKDLQSQGELPENVTVKSFREDGDITAGGDEHGSACAEIIHDVAPDAELFLVNYDDLLAFSRAVDWLVEQDVDVISHSACMLVGLFDGNDIWDKIIDEAVEEGIVWVNSAGNYAECHWEGRFNDPDGDGYHNFFENGDDSLSFFLHKGDYIRILLSWNDSWGYASQDYDMELIDSCGRRLKVSDREQSGRRGQIPIENISFAAPRTDLYHLKIYRYSATRDVHFETYTPYYSPEYNVRKSSLGGFATAKSSLTVGAFNCAKWGWCVMPYSSWGPTNDGRGKPELLAPSVFSTKSYYPRLFGGTSASAPHVAGAAALLLSKNPNLTPDEVNEKLIESANNFASCPPCDVTGYGLIDLSSGP